MRKYQFTDETMVLGGHTLHRVQAVCKFGDVKKGDLGGWIESEDNLSHFGKCWVAEKAKVFGLARVHHDAQIYGQAEVYGAAQIYDDAQIYGQAKVYDDAQIREWSTVHSEAQVYGQAQLRDNAEVCGQALIYGFANIKADACIVLTDDYLCIGPTCIRNEFITFYRSTDGCIMVSYGCFKGNIEEFKKMITETYGENKYGKMYRAFIQAAKEHFA